MFFTRVFLDYSEDPRSDLSRTYVWKSEFRPSKILAPFQISETFSLEYEHKDEAKLQMKIKCKGFPLNFII